MLDVLKNFISELSDSKEPKQFIHDKLQLAEAALLYHVMAVDGIIKDSEKTLMVELLAKHFQLSNSETNNLIIEAKTAEHEAIDLYNFTTILKHTLSEQERINIIEHLWEMVFVDDILHELEDNVIWRIAELLGVNSRNRVLLKQRVWKRHIKKEHTALSNG